MDRSPVTAAGPMATVLLPSGAFSMALVAGGGGALPVHLQDAAGQVDAVPLETGQLAAAQSTDDGEHPRRRIRPVLGVVGQEPAGLLGGPHTLTTA